LGRNRPYERRIFEGRYARGYLRKEKVMRLKKEATEQRYHVAEEDGMEPVVQGSG